MKSYCLGAYSSMGLMKIPFARQCILRFKVLEVQSNTKISETVNSNHGLFLKHSISRKTLAVCHLHNIWIFGVIASHSSVITVKNDSNCEFYIAPFIIMLIAKKEKIVNKFALLNHFNILLLPFLLTIQKNIYTQLLMSNGATWSLCGSLQKSYKQKLLLSWWVKYHNVPSILFSKTGKKYYCPHGTYYLHYIRNLCKIK